MKKITVFLIIIMFFLFSNISCYATSIIPPEKEDRTITFQPFFSKTLYFSIGGVEYLQSYTEGDLLDYIKIVDDNQNGPPRGIRVEIKFPESLPTGKYVTYIGALQIESSGGTIGTRAAIRVPIYTSVLENIKFVEFSLDAQDTNINSVGDVLFNVKSFTYQNITNIKGFADIYDSQGKKLTTIYSDEKSLPSDTSASLTAKLNTTGYLPGIYSANGTLNYDGNFTYASDTFRVGSLRIFIKDYTKEFCLNTINKMDVTIESDWGENINEVYAIINIGNQTLPKTPNTPLPKFSTATLTTYFDTKSTSMDNYTGKIEIFYKGDDGVYNKINEENIEVSVNKEKCADYEPDKNKKENKTTEEPKKLNISIPLSTTTILYIILIILVVFNLIYFLKLKKKKNT